MALTITGTQVVAKAEPTTLGARPGPASGIQASRQIPPLGWVRLEAEADRSLALLCKLGEGNLQPTSGPGGGWDEVPRSGRTPVSRWRHRTGLRIPVPLWMSSQDRTSIEAQIATLIGLAGRGPKWTEAEPPHLIFDTAGVSAFDVQTYPDQRWVIDGDIQWGTSFLHNHAGNLYRQDATVTLFEFTDDSLVVDQSLARRQQRGNLKVPKTYTVRAGDTLVSIARRELGSVDRWLDILKLNPGQKTDPRRQLQPGTVLKLR